MGAGMRESHTKLRAREASSRAKKKNRRICTREQKATQRKYRKEWRGVSSR